MVIVQFVQMRIWRSIGFLGLWALTGSDNWDANQYYNHVNIPPNPILIIKAPVLHPKP